MVRILAFLPLHGLGTLVIIPTKQSVYSSTVGGWEAIVMVGVPRSFGALVVSTWTMQLRVMR